MRSLRFLLVGLISILPTSLGRAENPADPLRLVPDEANLFAKIERPRKLIETVQGGTLLLAYYPESSWLGSSRLAGGVRAPQG